MESSWGCGGVHWNERDQRWVAAIQVNKRRINLGNFHNREDALVARRDAEVQYHGEFRAVR
jgi:hypothetical protein